MACPVSRWTPAKLAEMRSVKSGRTWGEAALELSRRWGERVSLGAIRGAFLNSECQEFAPPVSRPIAPVDSGAARAEQGRGVDVDVLDSGIGNGAQTSSGAEGSSGVIDEKELLRDDIRQLMAEVTRLRKSALTEERVRRELLRLSNAPSIVPAWLCDQDLAPNDSYGVPTAFGSDQHLGEVVDPSQIGGVNRYDMAIARERWKRWTEKTIGLCFNFLARPKFDGIVMALGGDGVSGNIHEELLATNEQDIGPIVRELADLIVWSTREFKRAFGRVFVPCVVGNHGRMTQKPRAKGAAFTSFDWLAYVMAAREFEGDPDVRFMIPSGTDASYQIYRHRYLLTHGSQFRGGDGLIGPLGPVTRGDHKKRSRNAQIGQEYDTLLIGHFHQYRQDRRIIMNGSLKGYDEYAYQGNFGFEPPVQALWITHPRMGITFSMPVLTEEPAGVSEDCEWVRAG